MKVLSNVFYQYRRIWKVVKLYLILSGPGLIVMIADNDAGGITTYSATGAKFGYGLIWFLLFLVPIAYFVQEMPLRLGAVTKRGHAESIFYSFGSFWGWFALLDLLLLNWLTLVTEFIGMTAALGIFGVPGWATVLGVCMLLSITMLNGRYWTWEKLSLLFCLLNLVYIPAAFMVHPSMSEVFHQGFIPHMPDGPVSTLFFYLMANIGTTIAPWMLVYQQSAVIDKGMKEKDIPWGRFDTLVGSVLTLVVAVFIIIVCGTLLMGTEIQSAAQATQEIMKFNHYLGTFLAIGLFNAGLLGAICISLASSWAFGEVFGWAHSLNNKIKQAPWFYTNYFLTLITAGIVVLIPGAPLVLVTLFVQVIAVTLLPAALVFLIIMLNDGNMMGNFKNTTWQNVITISIVIIIILLSTLYGISVLFPGFIA